MTDLDISSLFALDQASVRCPYGHFAALREEAPVTWVEEIDAFVVTRYDDVMAVVRDPERFSSAKAVGRIDVQTVFRLAAEDERLANALVQLRRQFTRALVNADPPLHQRQRNLVNRAFTPRRVSEAEPAIRQLAEELVDTFIGHGEVELVGQFAVPLPLSVIADRLGVPREDLPAFKRWSDDFTLAIGNHRLEPDELRAMLISQAEFGEYFETRVLQRQAEPVDELLSDLANATTADGDQLSLAEVLSMLMQLLAAGNETTTKLIASAMEMLSRSPSLADRLRAEPGLIDPFVEEVLRLESPVQGPYRVALTDTEVGGCAIPAGKFLWLAFASANRDGAAFAAPDEVDLQRGRSQPHLAFGAGPHFCLGAALARVEARIALGVLLERFGVFEQRDEGPPPYVRSYMLHGPSELWLRFPPVATGVAQD